MKQAPYGTWQSPITAADLARSSITLNHVRVAAGIPYWVESRPSEGGRYVIATSSAGGGVAEVTPSGFNIRTGVHEYGGTPYVPAPHVLYFTNWSDQRIYAQRDGTAPVALTPEGYRYADFELDRQGERLFCVREDHSRSGEPRNSIVVLSTSGGRVDAGTLLFGEADFVAYPRLSPDGRHLSWVAWNHPDMPWDATTLYIAELTASGLKDVTAIAAGPEESVVEPRWDADGTLYFISDRSGWWNLYRWSGTAARAVAPMAAELADPLWALGQANYALTGDGRAIVRYCTDAIDRLGILQLSTGQLRPLELPFLTFASVHLLSSREAVMIAASATAEPAIVSIDLESRTHRVLRAPSQLALDASVISAAEPIAFSTADGATAHAFYYPPRNAAFAAPSGDKAPLIVKVHGGPTSHTRPDLNPAIQYWTSRGFGLVDVNYGGSTGFGRAYRQRLNGNWGVVDVQDVVAAVNYLVARGRVDGNRVAIRGGSAGGFTVLAALAFSDVFKAGANYYGVSDLEALARDTHKFESRYLDRLIAPLPAGEAIYRERAPIHHLEGFSAPLITLQGAEDKVVPPAQSRAIVDALKRKGVPVAYIEFEGEQHGFRKAENIVRSLEAELAFYGQVFGFEPADQLPPVAMETGG